MSGFDALIFCLGIVAVITLLTGIVLFVEDMLGWEVECERTPPCSCACNHGGFCGGCGHAGCGGRR